MTFLRSMYPLSEERWFYRVRSTVIKDADGNFEWLYFHAESGSLGFVLLDTIIGMYGDVIDLATAQFFDEIEDGWIDLHWDLCV